MLLPKDPKTNWKNAKTTRTLKRWTKIRDAVAVPTREGRRIQTVRPDGSLQTGNAEVGPAITAGPEAAPGIEDQGKDKTILETCIK